LLLFDEVVPEPELLRDEPEADFTAEEVLLEDELVTVLPELELTEPDLLTGAVTAAPDLLTGAVVAVPDLLTILFVLTFSCDRVLVFDPEL